MISSALSTILMYGSFLWSNSITPSGLAALVILMEDIISNDMLHEGIVLDYLTKHESSGDSLTKLAKTQVIYPTEIEATIQ